MQGRAWVFLVAIMCWGTGCMSSSSAIRQGPFLLGGMIARRTFPPSKPVQVELRLVSRSSSRELRLFVLESNKLWGTVQSVSVVDCEDSPAARAVVEGQEEQFYSFRDNDIVNGDGVIVVRNVYPLHARVLGHAFVPLAVVVDMAMAPLVLGIFGKLVFSGRYGGK